MSILTSAVYCSTQEHPLLFLTSSQAAKVRQAGSNKDESGEKEGGLGQQNVKRRGSVESPSDHAAYYNTIETSQRRRRYHCHVMSFTAETIRYTMSHD